jgi:hypothetical protein
MMPSTTKYYVMNSAGNLIREITFAQRGHLIQLNAYYVCNGPYFRWQKLSARKLTAGVALALLRPSKASP